MASIRIDSFKGLMPRIHPASLPPGMAQEAHNLVIKNTRIVPLRNSAPRGSVPEMDGFDCVMLENYGMGGFDSVDKAGTIYAWKRRVRINGELKLVTTVLAWPGKVTVAKSNLADDDRDRIFVTGDTGIPWNSSKTESEGNQPCVYLNDRESGTITRRTMVMEKLQAPEVAVTVGGNADHDRERVTYYYQTWVSSLGYESPVSDPSRMIKYNDGDTVHLMPCEAPDGAVARRIYKAVTGDNTEDNRFVIEFSGDTAWMAHDFSVDDATVAMTEKMPSVKAPPSDLRDMTYVPGCYYTGFSESNPHTVMFTQLNIPYNWSEEYWYDVHDNIVGLAVTKNTVYALTDNCVWILRGTDPSTMVASSLSPAACVSRRSICVHNNNVYFASNHGLCVVMNSAVDGDIVVNVTEKFFTKDQWKALDPGSCRIVQMDGRLHAFFSGHQYIFDLNEQECMLTTHDEKAGCACVDHETDSMYMAGGEG